MPATARSRASGTRSASSISGGAKGSRFASSARARGDSRHLAWCGPAPTPLIGRRARDPQRAGATCRCAGESRPSRQATVDHHAHAVDEAGFGDRGCQHDLRDPAATLLSRDPAGPRECSVQGNHHGASGSIPMKRCDVRWISPRREKHQRHRSRYVPRAGRTPRWPPCEHLPSVGSGCRRRTVGPRRPQSARRRGAGPPPCRPEWRT